MQKFCLAPSRASYDKIIARVDTTDENIKVWMRTCENVYNYIGLNDDESIEAIKSFAAWEESMCKECVERPSRAAAMRILHMFFATGTLRHLALYYESLGKDQIPLATRRELTNIYIQTRFMYQAEIANLGLVERDFPSAGICAQWRAITFECFSKKCVQCDGLEMLCRCVGGRL